MQSNVLNSILVLLALVISIDFVLPGTAYSLPAQDKKTQHQSYYNAGGNSHTSYSVHTTEHSFVVSESFSRKVDKESIIDYTVSPIFKEVNRYQIKGNADSEIYSLRWFTGLLLPLFALGVFSYNIRFKKENIAITSVTTALLFGDLIYLLI